MQLPQINLNGTSKQDLLENYFAALRALREAESALSSVWPHGRDYQTLPPGCHQTAMNEHADRVKRLRQISAEIETLTEALV